MRIFNLLLVAALLAVTPSLAAAPFGDQDRFALIIDSGRLGVMMDQSGALIPAIAVPDQPPRPDTPAGDRAVIFEHLVSAVLSYNLLAHQACERRIVDAKLCTGAYLPRWLNGRAGDYSDRQMRDFADEAVGRLMPFWSALCDKTPPPADGSLVCPME